MLTAGQFRAFEAKARRDAEDYRDMAGSSPRDAERFTLKAMQREEAADWYAKQATFAEWMDERRAGRSVA